MRYNQSYPVINEIMDTISEKFPELKWKKHCLYTNGIDQHVMEIRFYCEPEHKVVGRVVYDAYNGKVIRMHYRRENSHNCGNIVDSLLDIFNIETERVTPVL
jgi:hypothetical protein